MKQLLLVGAIAALMTACATVPERSDKIEEARAAIDTLAADPLAQQSAGHDLEAARAALSQAEAALQQKQAQEVIDHEAYLARRHAEAGEARIAEARARQAVARGQDERNKILLESRERQAQVAQEQAANAQSRADLAKRQLEETQQQLADLQAKKTDRGMVVTLGDVLFDTAQATLKPGAELTLNRLATFLNANTGTKIIIEGHTDSIGSDEYNEALSERRAQAVASALISRGVSANQLQPLGRGKAYPVASNATPEGRQQNRRVEIVFSDQNGQFAQSAAAPR
jgi:OmpA-OmpF porin, OOP family